MIPCARCAEDWGLSKFQCIEYHIRVAEYRLRQAAKLSDKAASQYNRCKVWLFVCSLVSLVAIALLIVSVLGEK